MKKFIVTTALILGTASITLANPTGFKNKLRKLLQRTTQVQTMQNDGVVFVSFIKNKDGQIEILEINASSSDLAKHVEQKLQNLPAGELEESKTYNYRFDFDVR